MQVKYQTQEHNHFIVVVDVLSYVPVADASSAPVAFTCILEMELE